MLLFFCDAVMLQSCKLSDLQHHRKMRHYVQYLLKYVAKKDRHGLDPVLRLLQPYKPGFFPSLVHWKEVLSLASSASGCPVKRHRGAHTELHNLKRTIVLR